MSSTDFGAGRGCCGIAVVADINTTLASRFALGGPVAGGFGEDGLGDTGSEKLAHNTFRGVAVVKTAEPGAELSANLGRRLVAHRPGVKRRNQIGRIGGDDPRWLCEQVEGDPAGTPVGIPVRSEYSDR